MRTRSWLLLALGGSLLACRTPTQISVEVSTNVPCASWHGAAIAVGELGPALELAPATTTSTYCDATGHVGTLVAVPRSADDANVAFRVIGAVSQSLEACTRDAGGGGCIVARRALNFIPHQALAMSVPLLSSCEGILCDPTSTCVGGECRPATIVDPGACAGQPCGEGALPLADGGTVADGGTGADGGLDAAPSVDATLSDGEAADASGADAATTLDGATSGCGAQCALSLGASFTCALRAGVVTCWGQNFLGELGIGTQTASELPGPVHAAGGGSLTGVAGIVSGYDTSCAFLSGGGVSCWGGAAPFALPGSELSATTQSLLAGASAISIANYHLCWQHGGALSCATTNPDEAPSFGDVIDAGPDAAIISTVTPPAGSPGPFPQIDSSPYFTCVLDGAGAVYCLGDNDSNESNPAPGSPSGVLTSFSPAPTTNGLPVLELALTQQAACARQHGHVLCWGSTYMGASGAGSQTMNEIVYADGGAIADPVSITAGELHSCVLLASAQVACWGDNEQHQLGRGEPVAQPGGSSTSAAIVRLADGGPFTGVTGVAAGGNHTCATTSDGTLWCWGENAYGQTAPGDQTARSAPTPVSY